jgi:hypothetical protein
MPGTSWALVAAGLRQAGEERRERPERTNA